MLSDLVSSASSSSANYPASAMYARENYLNSRGTANYRNAVSAVRPSSQMVNTLLQQMQPGQRISAILGQMSGTGPSPGLAKTIQLLSRYNQATANPYNARGAFSNPLRSFQNQGKLQFAYSNRQMLPPQAKHRQNWRGLTTASKGKQMSNPGVTSAPTTPKFPVVTEFEYEGPTTTPLPKRVAKLQQVGSMRGISPIRGSAPIPRQQTVAQTAWNYNSQPYQPSSSIVRPPPGFVSIDAFRADIMSAIQLLTNEITVMTNGSGNTSVNSGKNAIPTAVSPTSRKDQAAVITAKKLANLPGDLSFLIGKFASKLPQKISPESKATAQSSQNIISSSYVPPQNQQPRSEWSGLFDMAQGQQPQLPQGTWSQSKPQQWPSPQQQQPPQPHPQGQISGMQTLQGHQPLQTTPVPQQNQQQQLLAPQFSHQPQQQPPLQDLVRQSHSSPWQRQPPEPVNGTSTVGYQQFNQSIVYEPQPQQQQSQQPPPLDPNQQGPPNVQTQHQPQDMPGQQSWQQQPSQHQQPLDLPWSRQPPPQDFAPSWQEPPPGPSWREPPPRTSWQEPPPRPSWQEPPPRPSWQEPPPRPSWQEPPPRPSWQEPPPLKSHSPPIFSSPNHQQQYHSGPQPLDINQGFGSQPQLDPQPLDMSWQHQQPAAQQYQQQQQPPLDPQLPQQAPPQDFAQPPTGQHPQSPSGFDPNQQPQQPNPAEQQYYQQNIPQQPPTGQPPQSPSGFDPNQQPQQPNPAEQQYYQQNIPQQPPTGQPPQSPSGFDPNQQPQQPNPVEQQYYQQNIPQQPQRPPPLDIGNYRAPNSYLEPRQEIITSNSQNFYEPPPLEQAPWAPPVDFGGKKFVTITPPI